MTATLLIRPALADDVPALWALQQAAYTPLALQLPSRPSALGEDPTHWRARLQAAPDCIVVAQVGEELVGAGRIDGGPPCAELKRIAVHPAWQGRGIGRQLIAALEQCARDQGIASLRAGTRRRLPGNVAFYERLGYCVVAVEPYPSGIDDETIWLEKPM